MGQAEEYLDRIPMWTRKKNSLEDVRRFLDYLGNPDRDRPAIHVAGTNGKGSVCAFLTSILEEAGYSTGTVISMGNPHLVIFVDEMDQADLASVGPLLECLPLFPDRTNVEFVQVLKPDEVRMRVWERGSGITQACGTGACATAVAGVVRGKTKRKTKVIMDGGPLTIEWDERSGKVFMTGGAVNVFEGFIKV